MMSFFSFFKEHYIFPRFFKGSKEKCGIVIFFLFNDLVLVMKVFVSLNLSHFALFCSYLYTFTLSPHTHTHNLSVFLTHSLFSHRLISLHTSSLYAKHGVSLWYTLTRAPSIFHIHPLSSSLSYPISLFSILSLPTHSFLKLTVALPYIFHAYFLASNVNHPVYLPRTLPCIIHILFFYIVLHFFTFAFTHFHSTKHFFTLSLSFKHSNFISVFFSYK